MPNIETIDIIGHIGYAFVFLGTVALARKWMIGWLMRAVGATIWLLIGVAIGMTSLWFWEGLFLVCDCYGWYTRNRIPSSK